MTEVRFSPGALSGRLRVPGDKSLSHRALILGALAGRELAVAGLAPSGDVAATAGALRALGAEITLAADADGNLAGTVAGPLREAADVLDCGNAGTGIRLLAGVVAGIDGLSVLTGDGSLRRRPMNRVAVPLRAMGAQVDGRGTEVCPPLVIRGGGLRGITYTSPVASAQVKSCLLLAGLRAEGRTVVRSPLASRDHTERMLGHLGITVARTVDEDGVEEVVLDPAPLAPAPIQVSGDPSSAAFWLVAAAIAGTEVQVDGVCLNPGRTGVLEVLAALGAEVVRADEHDESGEPVGAVTVRAGTLDGQAEVSGRQVVDALDELPALAVAGALSSGGLRVRDAGELRVKESDRIDALAHAFSALGLEIATQPDGFEVPGGQRPAGGGRVAARGDHRIAMTAAIASTVAEAPVEVTGFESVATSYPTFLADFSRLGGDAAPLA